jgi:hypothetical protein
MQETIRWTEFKEFNMVERTYMIQLPQRQRIQVVLAQLGSHILSLSKFQEQILS